MKIIVPGAGTTGTVYGVCLALAGHAVTLVARGKRAAYLREHGARIENLWSGKRAAVHLPVIEELQPDGEADLCLVTVRREQIPAILPRLQEARGIKRFLLMANYAGDPRLLFSCVQRRRLALGFPGVAGGIEDGVARYVFVARQRTAVEAAHTDIATALRGAGFAVALAKDMPSWLQRHALFVTAIGAALCEAGMDAQQLSSDRGRMHRLILAVREGWEAMDGKAIAPEPLALKAMFRWMPLPISVSYWCRLLAAPRGECYFARHFRNAASEMQALANDIRRLVPAEATPRLYQLFEAIDRFYEEQHAGAVPAQSGLAPA